MGKDHTLTFLCQQDMQGFHGIGIAQMTMSAQNTAFGLYRPGAGMDHGRFMIGLQHQNGTSPEFLCGKHIQMPQIGCHSDFMIACGKGISHGIHGIMGQRERFDPPAPQ